MVSQLDKQDGEEEGKIYCYKVRRNGEYRDQTGVMRQAKRTTNNRDKTRLLRPFLYQQLEREETVSFCYSADPAEELTDAEILARWADESKK